MAIIRNEQFNCPSDDLYKHVKSYVISQMKELSDIVNWNDVNRKGEVNYKGVKGIFSITESSNLQINISIGLPASLKYSEKEIDKSIEQLYSKMKENINWQKDISPKLNS